MEGHRATQNQYGEWTCECGAHSDDSQLFSLQSHLAWVAEDERIRAQAAPFEQVQPGQGKDK